MFRNSLKQAES